MKLIKIAALAALSTTVFAAGVSLNSTTNKTSYAMGFETGSALKAHGADVNTQAFAAGMQDAISGKKAQMSQKDMQQVLAAFQKASIKKMQAHMKKAAATNASKGASFLAANAKKAGVITTKSGLQYKILTPGKGTSPKATDKVTVNYVGKLLNGKVFDSSYKRGVPATFPVNGVIPGWTEALQMMKPGATWVLWIPAKLAYGANGVPGVIPPNAVLNFKVNLIKVN